MSFTNDTREVYNDLQQINLQERESWCGGRSEVDEWCRFEGGREEEAFEVYRYFLFNNRILSVLKDSTNQLAETATHYILTNRSDSITTKTIHHVETMPEYPETSLDGVLYCVNIHGLELRLAKKLHESVCV
jgi:hypothetical protein